MCISDKTVGLSLFSHQWKCMKFLGFRGITEVITPP